MPNATQVPEEIVIKWQEIVDLLAEIVKVPAALIMRVESPNIGVFLASESKGNPYEPAEIAPLNTGLYCETVMKTRQPLLVPDALLDEDWKSNPDIKLGMISYMGVPVSWPDGEIFGTICVLDRERNEYNETFLRLLLQWRDVLQADLRTITTLNQALEERETKIRHLVDANIVGIFFWERGGSIEDCNEAFLRIIGYEPQTFVPGQIHWTDLTPPEWIERDHLQWIPELKQTGRLQPIEKEILREDGRRVPVLFGAATLDESGSRGVAFVLDLTERKRAEADARESERRFHEIETVLAHANRVATLGHLVAAISHEVKQPVAACAMNAEAGKRWLGAAVPNLDEARSAFERISREARRVGDITDRVRRLVKNAPPDKEPVSVSAAIREIITLTRGEAEKNGVSVTLLFSDDLPPVQYDRVQLQQVVLNLVMNAIEAMSECVDGRRDLSISANNPTSDTVLVVVADTGPGIAPDAAERLFEPFYTTKTGGMGMGLSVCRSVVRAHGGTFEVSANMPRGAVFRFTAPASV